MTEAQIDLVIEKLELEARHARDMQDDAESTMQYNRSRGKEQAYDHALRIVKEAFRR